MARPSKLSDGQWAEIGRRLAKGERVIDLAQEFKVSKSTISGRFSERTETLQAIAKQVASAEISFEKLGVSEQVSVRSLADELKGISTNLAAAAHYGAKTAHRMAAYANQQAEKLDDSAGPIQNGEAMKAAMMAQQVGNEAAKVGMGLMATASKGAVSAGGSSDDDGSDLSPADRAFLDRAHEDEY